MTARPVCSWAYIAARVSTPLCFIAILVYIWVYIPGSISSRRCVSHTTALDEYYWRSCLENGESVNKIAARLVAMLDSNPSPSAATVDDAATRTMDGEVVIKAAAGVSKWPFYSEVRVLNCSICSAISFSYCGQSAVSACDP